VLRRDALTLSWLCSAGGAITPSTLERRDQREGSSSSKAGFSGLSGFSILSTGFRNFRLDLDGFDPQ